MDTNEITWTMRYECPVQPGQTITGHRGAQITVAAVAPLRADGAVWGLFTEYGALITRIAGIAR